MICRNCSNELPQGVAACPFCGSATNAMDSGSSSPYDPTAMASQPPYGTPPPTAYGTPSYGAPPPPPADPYNAPLQPPVNPYTAPPPPQYRTSPMPAPTIMPVQQGAYVPPSQPGTYGYSTPPPKRRSRTGLIVGIVLLVVLLACVGVSAFVFQAVKQGVTTATTTLTAVAATATNLSTSHVRPPSGRSIDPTAAAIMMNLQMASAVDKSTAAPTQLATTFTVHQAVYATVELNLHGRTGYAEAKWYGNGRLVRTSIVLSINKTTYTNAYFNFSYATATQGVVEVYWCTRSNCSDARLAGATNFTVT